MSKSKAIKESLLELEPIEIYYRKKFSNIKEISAEEFKSLINEINQNKEQIGVNKTEDYLLSIEYLSESDFINDDNDISVIKHLRFLPPFNHKHNFFELIYVSKGSCTNFINGREFVLKEGSILMIPPDIRHSSFINGEDDIVLNILIRKSTFDTVFFELLRFNKILSTFFGKVVYSNSHSTYLIFHTEGDENIEAIILEMFKETIENLKYSRAILNGLTTSLFGYIMRYYENSMEVEGDFATNLNEIDDILDYIYDNFLDVNLDSLAEHFKFSKFYISKLIKSYTGKNFVKITQDIKMKKAIDLLINTNLPVEDIGNTVGYSSSSNFIRTFKKHYGMSPTDYRNNIN